MWLALSLACAGAVLPASFVPGALTAIAPLMPVAQLAQGLRAAVAGGATSAAPAVALALWTVAGLVAVSAAAWRRGTVRPELIGR